MKQEEMRMIGEATYMFHTVGNRLHTECDQERKKGPYRPPVSSESARSNLTSGPDGILGMGVVRICVNKREQAGKGYRE